MKTLLISGIYRPEIGGPATYIPALATELQSQNGAVEALPKEGSWGGLNSVLHAN